MSLTAETYIASQANLDNGLCSRTQHTADLMIRGLHEKAHLSRNVPKMGTPLCITVRDRKNTRSTLYPMASKTVAREIGLPNTWSDTYNGKSIPIFQDATSPVQNERCSQARNACIAGPG